MTPEEIAVRQRDGTWRGPPNIQDLDKVNWIKLPPFRLQKIGEELDIHDSFSFGSHGKESGQLSPLEGDDMTGLVPKEILDFSRKLSFTALDPQVQAQRKRALEIIIEEDRMVRDRRLPDLQNESAKEWNSSWATLFGASSIPRKRALRKEWLDPPYRGGHALTEEDYHKLPTGLKIARNAQFNPVFWNAEELSEIPDEVDMALDGKEAPPNSKNPDNRTHFHQQIFYSNGLEDKGEANFLRILERCVTSMLPDEVIDRLWTETRDPRIARERPFAGHSNDQLYIRDVDPRSKHLKWLQEFSHKFGPFTTMDRGPTAKKANDVLEAIRSAFTLLERLKLLQRFVDPRNPEIPNVEASDASGTLYDFQIRLSQALRRVWIKTLHYRGMCFRSSRTGIEHLHQIMFISLCLHEIENGFTPARTRVADDAFKPLFDVFQSVENALAGITYDLKTTIPGINRHATASEIDTAVRNNITPPKLVAIFKKHFRKLDGTWLLYLQILEHSATLDRLMDTEYVEDCLIGKHAIYCDEDWELFESIWKTDTSNADPNLTAYERMEYRTWHILRLLAKHDASENQMYKMIATISQINRRRRNNLLMRDWSHKRQWKQLYYVFDTKNKKWPAIRKAIAEWHDHKHMLERTEPPSKNFKTPSPSHKANIWKGLFQIHPISREDGHKEIESWDDGCPICAYQFKANQTIVELNCGHLFHLPCIQKHFDHWGVRIYICPMCRGEWSLMEVEDVAVEVTDVWDNEDLIGNSARAHPNILDESTAILPGSADLETLDPYWAHNFALIYACRGSFEVEHRRYSHRHVHRHIHQEMSIMREARKFKLGFRRYQEHLRGQSIKVLDRDHRPNFRPLTIIFGSKARRGGENATSAAAILQQDLEPDDSEDEYEEPEDPRPRLEGLWWSKIPPGETLWWLGPTWVDCRTYRDKRKENDDNDNYIDDDDDDSDDDDDEDDRGDEEPDFEWKEDATGSSLSEVTPASRAGTGERTGGVQGMGWGWGGAQERERRGAISPIEGETRDTAILLDDSDDEAAAAAIGTTAAARMNVDNDGDINLFGFEDDEDEDEEDDRFGAANQPQVLELRDDPFRGWGGFGLPARREQPREDSPEFSPTALPPSRGPNLPNTRRPARVTFVDPPTRRGRLREDAPEPLNLSNTHRPSRVTFMNPPTQVDSTLPPSQFRRGSRGAQGPGGAQESGGAGSILPPPLFNDSDFSDEEERADYDDLIARSMRVYHSQIEDRFRQRLQEEREREQRQSQRGQQQEPRQQQQQQRQQPARGTILESLIFTRPDPNDILDEAEDESDLGELANPLDWYDEDNEDEEMGEDLPQLPQLPRQLRQPQQPQRPQQPARGMTLESLIFTGPDQNDDVDEEDESDLGELANPLDWYDENDEDEEMDY